MASSEESHKGFTAAAMRKLAERYEAESADPFIFAVMKAITRAAKLKGRYYYTVAYITDEGYLQSGLYKDGIDVGEYISIYGDMGMEHDELRWRDQEYGDHFVDFFTDRNFGVDFDPERLVISWEDSN